MAYAHEPTPTGGGVRSLEGTEGPPKGAMTPANPRLGSSGADCCQPAVCDYGLPDGAAGDGTHCRAVLIQ